MTLSPQKGKFIVIEGLEGAGKSTAIQLINAYLQEKVPSLILTREPGGTRVGDVVRKLLKEHVDGEVLDVHTELLLLYAARVQHITQVIKPTLNQGGWVLCDRFELSTIAYQGGGRGIPSEIIAQLSQWCLQGFSPDITFFLDIDPEQGLHRVSQRGQVDRIESESLAFFNKVHQAYHDALSTMKNVVIIDAGKPLKTVQESIIAELDRLFK